MPSPTPLQTRRLTILAAQAFALNPLATIDWSSASGGNAATAVYPTGTPADSIITALIAGWDWTAASDAPAAAVFGPPVAQAVPAGTPLQPRPGGACLLSVLSSLSGIVGVSGIVTVDLAPTSGGAWVTVARSRLLISAVGVTAEETAGPVPVPAGYWARVTVVGAVTLSGVRWDV